MDELIELNANETFIQKLDSLRTGDMSRADALRRAVVFLSYAATQEREGRHLGFVVSGPQGGSVVEEIIEVNS